MSWVKLDDTFYDNPKIMEVGLDGAGLYAMSLSYCGRHLTDGFVPASFARVYGKPRIVAKLVTASLWQETDGGWTIRDYLKENPDKQTVLDKRAAEAERKRIARHLESLRNPPGRPPGRPRGQTPESEYPQPQPSPQPQPDPAADPDQKREIRAVDRLPIKHDHQLRRILDLCNNPDDGSFDVLAKEANGMSESALAKVYETMLSKRGRVGVGYAVKALRSERAAA